MDRVAVSSNRSIERVVETLLYAPLGAGVKLIDEAPAALTRARQDLLTARYLGRLAVSQGVAQVKARLEASGTSPSAPAARTVQPSTPEPADETLVDSADTEPGPPTDVSPAPAVGDLALPDYDHLPGIDIVARLDSLSAAERQQIGRYERAHRNRRTVLGKLAQLEREP